MRRTEVLQDARMAVFFESSPPVGVGGAEPGGGDGAVGGERADVSPQARSLRRGGRWGLLDRRVGKASGKRIPSDRAEEVEALYSERYSGFTVKHFHEHLVKDRDFGWGYTWLKLDASRNLAPSGVF